MNAGHAATVFAVGTRSPTAVPWPVRSDVFAPACATAPVEAREEPVAGPTAPAGRLVVDRLALLRRHAGTPPDLLLTWGAVAAPAPAAVDVVVHLHGYSGRGAAMRITRDKEPISGLDLADPDDPARAGRTTPTLLVLPRGHFFGGRSGAGYTFPALQAPGALRALVDDALARLAGATGVAAPLGRLILTAHSGGGASLMAILRHTDPAEVHAFDALYGDPGPLVGWARRRAEDGTGALRVLYRDGEGTAPHSERVHCALAPMLTDALRPRFRVERTRVTHLQIPRSYGWRLLADPGADLPGTRPAGGRCAPRRAGGATANIARPDLTDLLADEAPRPSRCPDVTVAPPDRPKVLLRNSVHAAVRNAQRLLNAFHAYRVTAGQFGLRDAPLVEDCVYGDHTVRAVRSFQELVFPGLTAEHDSKIGSRTWEQLDAIDVPPGQTVARLTVESLAVTDDGFRGPLTWDQVVGLDTATVDVELVARGLPVATMPDRIAVTLSTRPVGHATGSGTVPAAISWDVPRHGPDAVSPRKVRYRVARPVGDIGPLLAVEKQVKEVATVVRNGGTSDAEFVKTLGWAPRGRATQPNVATASTGSAAGEVPDARTLFRAGGVEVLDVRVPARPNWQVPAAVARLVRSPADLFYYSGHGLSGSGKLAVDVGPSPGACPSKGPYADWLGPGDLTAVWRSPMDLDVLVLAGCSVLRIDTSTSPATGPGVAWTALLRAKSGPLTALLGYRKGAPCDSPNGTRIAAAFARRVAAGSSRFAHDWLTVNGDENANNAVAIDARGYWWIEGTLLGGYDIKGPAPLP